jgi:hypothetical protein
VSAYKTEKETLKVLRSLVDAELGPLCIEEVERLEKMAREHAEMLGVLKALVAKCGPCLCDALNPCWDGRPGDLPGQHWGGGEACGVCCARAAIVKVEGRS